MSLFEAFGFGRVFKGQLLLVRGALARWLELIDAH